MEAKELFSFALNLPEPWFIADVSFLTSELDGEPELHISILFEQGGVFSCPVEGCRETMSAYDTKERTWRHLNFFQYRTYIHALVPRVKCKGHGVKTVSVPWVRPGSGFTLLFENAVIELAKQLPVSAVGRLLGEHDTRLWRVVSHYVNKARQGADYSSVTALGIDETSKKGHRYITVMVDLHSKAVIYVTDGKDSGTIARFCTDFEVHQGESGNIRITTCDMSLGFKKGIEEHFPNSAMVIDKFHVIKHANEAVDAVRKEEVKNNQDLKKTKYLWLKNENHLSEKQRAKKKALMKKHLKTARAYSMRVELQEIYEQSGNRAEAEQRLKKLCSWMMRSRLEPMKALCSMLRNHWNEILNYFELRYTNAILEGMNSVIQNIKRRARGFRNPDFFKAMIYLVCGHLDLNTVLASYA